MKRLFLQKLKSSEVLEKAAFFISRTRMYYSRSFVDRISKQMANHDAASKMKGITVTELRTFSGLELKKNASVQ